MSVAVFGNYEDLDYYGDEEYSDSDATADKEPEHYNSKEGDPVIISSPTNFTVDMGQPLELPCKLKKSVNIQ